jgi:5-methylcytosine-specific restriction endonuclease McrA
METDHTCVLEKQICLRLNRSWLPIGIGTPRQAVVAMTGGLDGQPPVYAMDIMMDPDGSLSYASPVAWEDWIKLPVRESDLSIRTQRFEIRCPTVIICANYNKVPLKTPRLSSGTIWDRDGGVCQYSGRKLSRKEGNIDHVIPSSRGGRDVWENLVLAHKDINSQKANRTPEEAGLRLIRRPISPRSVPVAFSFSEANHPHWKPFLVRN